MRAVSDKLDSFIFRFMELLGIKLLLIVLSSVFLCVDKITQDYWAMVVLTVAGFRTFNQAVSIVKSGKAKGLEFDQTGAGKNGLKKSKH